MLRFFSHWQLPLVCAFVWWGMLIAMLIVWSAEGVSWSVLPGIFQYASSNCDFRCRIETTIWNQRKTRHFGVSSAILLISFLFPLIPMLESKAPASTCDSVNLTTDNWQLLATWRWLICHGWHVWFTFLCCRKYLTRLAGRPTFACLVCHQSNRSALLVEASRLDITKVFARQCTWNPELKKWGSVLFSFKTDCRFF